LSRKLQLLQPPETPLYWEFGSHLASLSHDAILDLLQI